MKITTTHNMKSSGSGKLTRTNLISHDFNGNSINFFPLCIHLQQFSDVSRLDKSPLLANGYNAPPTHLTHMPFMQMGHHGAPMMSPGMPPHLPRHDNPMMKNPNMPGIDAITRWLFCYFSIWNSRLWLIETHRRILISKHTDLASGRTVEPLTRTLWSI